MLCSAVSDYHQLGAGDTHRQPVLRAIHARGQSICGLADDMMSYPSSDRAPFLGHIAMDPGSSYGTVRL